MDDSLYIEVGDLAEALGLGHRTIRGWINPRRKTRKKLRAFMPLGNRKEGYKINVGDVREYLAALPFDEKHALRRFEDWAEKNPERAFELT